MVSKGDLKSGRFSREQLGYIVEIEYYLSKLLLANWEESGPPIQISAGNIMDALNNDHRPNQLELEKIRIDLISKGWKADLNYDPRSGIFIFTIS